MPLSPASSPDVARSKLSVMLENPTVLNGFDVIIPVLDAVVAPVMCAAPAATDALPAAVNGPSPPAKVSEKITVVTGWAVAWAPGSGGPLQPHAAASMPTIHTLI